MTLTDAADGGLDTNRDPLDSDAALPDIPASQDAIDRVFEYAWHRCNAFDNRSGGLKNRYRATRETIILLTWVTTLLAVLAALSAFDRVLSLLLFGLPIMLVGYVAITTPFYTVRPLRPLPLIRVTLTNIRDRFWQLVAVVVVFGAAIALTLALDALAVESRDLLFKLMLVTLPLVSTALLAFASRFEAGIAWVGFRLVSESIRRQIYALRVKMSLGPLTRGDLEGLRLHVLDQRNRLDELGISTPLWGATYEPSETLVRPLYVDDTHDNGYSMLSLDQYVNWRVVHQANWYRSRIQRDYGKTRTFRGWILFIGGLGAFLAAVDYGEFVAVTVAGITALQAWLSLREHEQTYNIHVRTLLKLEDRIAAYYIDLKRLGMQAEKTPAEQQAVLGFVESVENILDDERNMWKNSVLQGQEATEASIAQLVSATSSELQLEDADAGENLFLLPMAESEAAEAGADEAAALEDGGHLGPLPPEDAEAAR